MARNDKKFLAIQNVVAILSNSPEIQALVGDKIFPLVAPVDTHGDFIAYQRDGYKREDSKMGVAVQRSIFLITVVSDTHERSLVIADAVYDALEGDHSEYNMRIRMENYGEDYIDRKFIQVLQFYLE
jgi:hypothetical protein